MTPRVFNSCRALERPLQPVGRPRPRKSRRPSAPPFEPTSPEGRSNRRRCSRRRPAAGVSGRPDSAVGASSCWASCHAKRASSGRSARPTARSPRSAAQGVAIAPASHFSPWTAKLARCRLCLVHLCFVGLRLVRSCLNSFGNAESPARPARAGWPPPTLIRRAACVLRRVHV